MNNETTANAITRCVEAELAEFSVVKNQLSLVLVVDDEVELSFTFRVSALLFGIGFLDSRERGCCRLQLVHCSERLGVENERLRASSDFVSMMKEVREGLNLAYGMKVNSTGGPLLFQLKAGVPLATWIVEAPEDFEVTERPAS